MTLSKGTTVLTQTADSDGNALFESVEYGSWTATVTLDDITVTDTIEVQETIQKEMPLGLMLSSLPLKTTKLKIGGIKWVLKARDHAGYPSGSQTLISEFTVGENIAFGSNSNYLNSTLQSTMENIYESFGEHEKAYVLQTTRTYKNGSGAYPTFNEYVFPLTSVEVGQGSDAQMGSNIGFTGNADRICTIENGAAQYWWLADASSSRDVWIVSTDGTVGGNPPGSTLSVRPAMNLSPNTLLNEYPDSEGYYTIYRPVETANDLLIGDKIKIGGTKYIVKAKNHEGYPSGSVTLISEYIVQSIAIQSFNYNDGALKPLCEEYYNQLSQAEKDAIYLTTRKIRSSSGYPEFDEHIFVLNSTEVGTTSDSQMGTNIGFASAEDRKANMEGQDRPWWWLSDAYQTTYSYSAIYINANGGMDIASQVTQSYGFRPALNLIPTAPIAPMDNTGYYSIQGADTETQLMQKALNIVGIET